MRGSTLIPAHCRQMNENLPAQLSAINSSSPGSLIEPIPLRDPILYDESFPDTSVRMFSTNGGEILHLRDGIFLLVFHGCIPRDRGNA